LHDDIKMILMMTNNGKTESESVIPRRHVG
jgi:hypothetical protein